MIHRRLAVLIACSCLLPATVTADDNPVQDDATAAELRLQVHESRNVWRDFPGLNVDIRVSTNAVVHDGSIAVPPDGKYVVTLSNLNAHPWLDRKLESVLGHRRYEPAAEYDVQFVGTDDHHPSGRMIEDLSDGGQFRIRDDVMTEVHRRSENLWFTISTLEVQRLSDNSYLPRMTSVCYRDPKTGVIESNRANTFEWTEVNGFYVPRRTLTIVTKSDGKLETQEIVFSNHQISGNSVHRPGGR